MPGQAVADDMLPHEIAVTLDHRVGLTMCVRLVGKQRRVNAAVDDPRAAFASELAHFVTATRIAGMNADADDVAGSNRRGVNRIERFVHDDRIAPLLPRGRRQNVEPAGRDDGHAK